MRVTISEIARRAGVSTATVSRALNGSNAVNEATRRRIQQVADTLNYRPHEAARSLITSKTHTMGVVLPDLYGEFFSELIRGIDQRARRDRYHLLVSSSHRDLQELEAVLRTMWGRVDGLIVMLPDVEAATLAANLPSGLPVVLVNCALQSEQYPAISIDNYVGAREMTRHLLRHGHKHLGIINGTEGNFDASERLRGCRDAVREAGDEASLLELAGNFTEQSGYQAARMALERMPRPTALFAANDAMAIGAIRALRDAGLRIPDDVAVAGFDDIPVARYISPALSSVHVPISELGQTAVQLLTKAISGKDEQLHQRHLLSTHLVIRESCGGHR